MTVVVDTTVWVDLFRGHLSYPHVEEFLRLIDADDGIAITDVILTEILQGLTSEEAVERIERKMAPFDVLRLEGLDDFRLAATLYRRARTRGRTIRRTLDCLIAAVCIRHDVPLLHNDRDFDHLASTTELQIHTVIRDRPGGSLT